MAASQFAFRLRSACPVRGVGNQDNACCDSPRPDEQQLEADPNEPDLGPRRGPAGYLHIWVDQFNADVFNAHEGWTREQALEWSGRVSNELLTALTRLPPERVLGGAGRRRARMWYWMPALIHSRGHRRRVMRQLLGEAD
jgi:hypothetical protein